MKVERLITTALLTFSVFIGSSCDHSLGPGVPSGDHIYFNSFESPQDTVGWRGGMQFRNEAPPSGGRQSIFISGGCVVPHAYIEFDGIDKGSHLLLRCWGKNLAIGGIVELQVADDRSRTIGIGVAVAATTWKFYQSADTLYWPANHRLKLSLSSGGLKPSAMLVDQIDVIKVV
ncbi:hypothetical protein L0337_29700 [candidate division KSB1 bacterium]|nr:hypothetical protein [candidate division KSB1 bacterium]